MFKETHSRKNDQPVNEIAGEVMVSDNSLKDRQQLFSPVSVVHKNKVNKIKKTETDELETKKKEVELLKNIRSISEKEWTYGKMDP